MDPRLVLLLLCAPAVLAFCPKIFNNQTACSCDSTVEGPVIRCSGPSGLGLVEKLKTSHMEIRELALENAHIIEIGPRAFKNLRIKKLVLDKNRIKDIHRDAFRGLENVMQELSISENNLQSVPTKALSGLKALNVLHLKCNKIQNITEQAFENMNSLIDVNLSCNEICKMAPDTFKTVHLTLQNLILDNNCMVDFPSAAVRNMENLIALHIKYNKIAVIKQHDLTNLTGLSMLSLTGNNISTIQGGAVANTPNLRYLYINENNIQSFDNGVMAQFKQAQVIDLSFNNITEITKEMFEGLESIQHLNLDSNAIKSIAPGAFAGTPILLLWLPNNCLTEVSQQTFQGALFLRQVSLANNNIKTVQQLSFAHLANLHTLDLASNKIMTLEVGSLTGADHLMVRLQENPMICTENGFHVMNGNEAINLTTEVNRICEGNWQAETVDLCPKAQPRPAPTPCCTVAEPTTTTTTTEVPTTTTTTTKAPTTTMTEKAQDDEEEEEEEEEEVVEEGDEEEEEVAEDETTTPEPSTTTKKAESNKKMNMDRFWRLSKKPSANSPFMRHAQGNKPKFLRTTTTTTEAPVEEEEEPEEDEEAEYVEDDEDSKTEEEVTTTTAASKVPARIRERQRMMANMPPWMARGKAEEPVEEFNRDDEVESVNNDESAKH